MTSVFFSHPRNSIRHYYELPSALLEYGIEVQRVDDLAVGSNWLATVVAAIKKSDVLLAYFDAYDRSPNVALEVGYAIGAGKQVVLLSDSPTEIPFDLSSIPVISIHKMSPVKVEEIASTIKKLATKRRPQVLTYGSAREQLAAAIDDHEAMEALSPVDFERLVGEIFIELGLQAEILSGRNESGFDILLHLPGRRHAAVLVKKYTSQGRLGIGDVQRLVGACVVTGISSGIMITTTGFTSSAREFASRGPVGMHLMTIDELLSVSAESLIEMCAFDSRLKGERD